MFFSKLKKLQNQNPEYPDQPEETTVEETKTGTEAARENASASVESGAMLSKLFHKQEDYAGPETSYENESWAPESNIGLFRKKRAVAEEQLPSSSDAQ